MERKSCMITDDRIMKMTIDDTAARLAQFSSDIFRVNCMAASAVVEVPISVSR